MKRITTNIIILSTILFALFSFPQNLFAQSDYVLPYPSAMPGNKVYQLNKLYEKVSDFWAFGSFGEYHFTLKYSDKYLVEAKTLFEYKQYLLASTALRKSDDYFIRVTESLATAQSEGKNIAEKQQQLRSAAQKHREVLLQIKPTVPEGFTWDPEIGESEALNLHSQIENSITIHAYN